MTQEFTEVQIDDFMKITTDPLPHQLIESALSALGGGGTGGMNFKQEMLKRAGWKGNKLTSFAKDPDSAAKAFNKVRLAFSSLETDHPDDLRNALEK